MKKSALDQIDTNLEQIIIKLTEAGQRSPAEREELVKTHGTLPALEFDSLKLAQETLSLLRTSRAS